MSAASTDDNLRGVFGNPPSPRGKIEHFAPTAVVDGRTVTPPGWMWIFAFAINGCKWAIQTADTEEFKETVRTWLKDRKNHHLQGSIEYHQKEIERLKKELRL